MPSSKLRRSASGTEDECKLDMSPMIDMVFLLLIFFIVNATAIIVKTDPEVKPPIAKNAKLQENKEGRIVVNVRNDGTYTSEDFTILPDEDAIQDYVKKARDRVEQLSITPRLHLRGDKEALFKHGRVAVRAAAAAGVNQVLFATFIRDPGY
ncbi:MAG: ExbD/TolR family protein [Luteolibacter sp.]